MKETLSSRAGPSAEPLSPGRRISVLIVDDHRMFAEAIQLLLEPDFDVVGVAVTGEEAIDICRDHHPDVVLMDISLPGIDGIEAARRIKEECPDIQIVATSALYLDRMLEDLRAAGVSGFLPKSHTADRAREAIERAAAGDLTLPSRAS